MDQILDCIIIGAGPGGLIAGIYLQRYRRNIAILDNSASRVATIPRSHNYPGFPDGITGLDLLTRLREQLHRYQGEVIADTVQTITRQGALFKVTSKTHSFLAKNIILATGASDIEPSLPNLRDTVRRGLIRHCPICDAYEVIDQHIGIIGSGDRGIKAAFFLRAYSPHITLLSLGDPQYSPAKMRQLKTKGIKLVKESVKNVTFDEHRISAITTQDDQTYEFETIYSALGSIIHSKLAIDLGAKNENQCLIVNRNQETTVKGLYAVGDVTKGLSQICVATAGGAIAATQINNKLDR